MRTIVKLILGLAVAALFGAVASSASATPVWGVCTNLEAKIGLFEDAKCTKEKAEGEYGWLEVSGTEKVSLAGATIRLEDSKTAVGKSTVQCGHGVGAGVIGPENKGLITEVKVNAPKTECEVVEGGCKKGEVEKVEGRNLPWQTEIFETEKKLLTQLEATTSGKEPGWAVECNTLLGKKTDECDQEAGKPESAELENRKAGPKEEELLVLAKLENKRMAHCSEGGAEAGAIGGLLRIGDSGGAGLKVAPGKIVLEKSPWGMKANVPSFFMAKNDSPVTMNGMFTIKNPTITKDGNFKLINTPKEECRGKANWVEMKTCEIGLECTKAGERGKIFVATPNLNQDIIDGKTGLTCE
jgi:hypothetical protein